VFRAEIDYRVPFLLRLYPKLEGFDKILTDIYLINTPTNAHYSFSDLKFTLKHLKRSYMFRSHDHPQGAYTVPC